MSTDGPFDPNTEPLRHAGDPERKRAAVALGVLAAAALVLVGVMLYVFGGGGGGTTAGAPQGPVPSGPAVTVTGGASHSSSGPGTAAPGSTAPSSTVPASGSSSTSRGPVSCPTSAPCALADDVGNAVQAVNAYRSAHGVPPVTGSVTEAAKTCALSTGNTCPSDFFWEPVGGSGQEVVSKIAASGSKGSSWLLDRSMRAVQVGWAYLPSSKSFECALIATH